jgi:hypothetical protein
MFDVAMALERSDVVLTIARDCLWLGALGAWPAVLQQAIVKDAAIVYFVKSQFKDEIGDFGPRILLFSK